MVGSTRKESIQLANFSVKCFQIVSTTHLDSLFSVNPYYILEEVFSKGFEPTWMLLIFAAKKQSSGGGH